MEIKLNLQLKLLTIVFLVIILTLSSLSYLSINNQRNLSYASFQDLAIVLAQAMDASIATRAELKDINKLQSSIYKIIWLNPNITQISICLPIGDNLEVIASNDTTLVGKMAVPESFLSYQEGSILTKILTGSNGNQVFRVITPVHVGGQIVGTYDIRLTLDTLEQTISENQRQFLLVATITTLSIISTLFLVIKIMVIKPLQDFQEGMKIIGSGSLDYKIKIKTKDEIGNLVLGFNKMTEELKNRTKALAKEKASLEQRVQKRTQELEKERSLLEIKVKFRTKELEKLNKTLEEKVQKRTKDLQKKLKELERFKKLTVGRELRMVELKKEIKELKENKGRK